MFPCNEYERKFLAQHNPGTSPQKSQVLSIFPSETTCFRFVFVAIVDNKVDGHSPRITPTKYRPDGGDRYIPIRQSSSEWATRFAAIASSSPDAPNLFKRPNTGMQGTLIGAPSSGNIPNAQAAPATSAIDDSRMDSAAHRALLRNELLSDNIDDIRADLEGFDTGRLRDSPSGGLFKFRQRTPTKYGDASTSHAARCLFGGPPLSEGSQRLLKSPRKPQRKVPKNPYKVLDAPELQDDFYLDLVDWSSQNMLSVGLHTCVYLWSACNSQVVKLCDLATDGDSVTSVQWADKGDLLAVGTNKGITQIWDVHAQKRVRELTGHSSRIGCLAWNTDLVCSGSRDRFIIQRDIRQPAQYAERRLNAHRQEVCGLKWSPDRQYLASGGNDNQVLVWSLRRNDPCQVYTEHNAAVKALAWSPHHHGLLVSGGGTADRCLRFWNTLTGQSLHCIDTGSQACILHLLILSLLCGLFCDHIKQHRKLKSVESNSYFNVCNVAWSKHSSELVSTHGYSYNQVIIWKYPSLQPVTKLTGHQYRVLYLAMSPDGESIVTGAGDETLRFWHVFSKVGQQKVVRSKLNLLSSIR
uniref:WD_REPEATS_REGION domain-containing protein n=1 Tax=Elaeophora elaphi TaxID=1147741 RepID=A0A0R3RS07_9BILA